MGVVIGKGGRQISLQSTYEELKLSITINNAPVRNPSLQSTYEELKLVFLVFELFCHICLQSTYEELKLFCMCLIFEIALCLQSTYEELKPNFKFGKKILD